MQNRYVEIANRITSDQWQRVTLQDMLDALSLPNVSCVSAAHSKEQQIALTYLNELNAFLTLRLITHRIEDNDGKRVTDIGIKKYYYKNVLQYFLGEPCGSALPLQREYDNEAKEYAKKDSTVTPEQFKAIVNFLSLDITEAHFPVEEVVFRFQDHHNQQLREAEQQIERKKQLKNQLIEAVGQAQAVLKELKEHLVNLHRDGDVENTNEHEKLYRFVNDIQRGVHQFSCAVRDTKTELTTAIQGFKHFVLGKKFEESSLKAVEYKGLYEIVEKVINGITSLLNMFRTSPSMFFKPFYIKTFTEELFEKVGEKIQNIHSAAPAA